MSLDGQAVAGIGFVIEQDQINSYFGVTKDEDWPDEKLKKLISPLKWTCTDGECEGIFIGKIFLEAFSTVESCDYPITITETEENFIKTIAKKLGETTEIKFYLIGYIG